MSPEFEFDPKSKKPNIPTTLFGHGVEDMAIVRWNRRSKTMCLIVELKPFVRDSPLVPSKTHNNEDDRMKKTEMPLEQPKQFYPSKQSVCDTIYNFHYYLNYPIVEENSNAEEKNEDDDVEYFIMNGFQVEVARMNVRSFREQKITAKTKLKHKCYDIVRARFGSQRQDAWFCIVCGSSDKNMNSLFGIQTCCPSNHPECVERIKDALKEHRINCKHMDFHKNCDKRG